MTNVPHDEATKGNATACTVKETIYAKVARLERERAEVGDILAMIQESLRNGKDIPNSPNYSISVSAAALNALVSLSAKFGIEV